MLQKLLDGQLDCLEQYSQLPNIHFVTLKQYLLYVEKYVLATKSAWTA
jgi:hypothetical protein